MVSQGASSEWRVANGLRVKPFATRYSLLALLFNNHQWLAEFDRLAVLDQDLRHGAGAR